MLERFSSPWRRDRESKTAAYSIGASETGKTFDNLGASGAVTLTLPQVGSNLKGVIFNFVVAAAQDFRIDPGAGGAFYVNGAKQSDDKYLESAYIGDMITVESDNNGDWVVSGVTVIDVSSKYNAASVDDRFMTANRPWRVIGVRATVTVAGSDGSAVTAEVEKVPSGTAIASGVDIATATFNLKGTANTVQAGTLTSTDADLDLVAGDSLAVDFTGTLTAATGVITVALSNWKVEG
jgi:hypothetical protein|tara:strand:+ start:2136 stop:2846 length:711 start_codon:yes stop_codon:yes gene_type:complete